MPKIAIVTDTNASLPTELIARHSIRMVPIPVHFGAETLLSCAEIDDAALFARVHHGGSYPTTSAPSPGQFASAYQAALDSGAEEVICFCMSSAASATYSSALQAREMTPAGKIHVVDTQRLSLGMGFMVLSAAEAAEAGATSQEIMDLAQDVSRRTHFFAALATLKYLAMSGRVSHLRAGVGDLLHFKPILSIHEGKLSLRERVRTQSRAWQRLIELARQSLDGGQAARMAILHVNDLPQAQRFEQQVRTALPCPDDIFFTEATPGISLHAGAGTIGLALTKR